MLQRTTPEEREIAGRLGHEAERIARGLGMSASAASIRANGNPDTIREMKNGHVPKSLKLYRLADVLMTSMHDMMKAAIADRKVSATVSEAGEDRPPIEPEDDPGDQMLDMKGLGPASRLALMTLVEELKSRASTS